MAIDFRSDRVGESAVQVVIGLEIPNGFFDLGRELHVVVLLLHLVNVLSLHIGVLQQTRSHRSESGVRGRQEDSGDIDDVSWVDGPGKTAVKVDSH